MVAIVRYGTRAGPDNQKILRVNNETIRMQNHGVISIDLTEVARMENLQRLDIANNRLESVDLSSLAKCKELRYLDLSENRLHYIDLSSLGECTHLQRLDISHNQLREIDISPLVNCSELKEIYLQENRIGELDATALLNCPYIEQLRIDSSGTKRMILIGHVTDIEGSIRYVGDPLLEYAIQQKRPSWLKHEQMKPLPKFQSYSWLVKKFGWAKNKKWMMSISNLLGVNHQYPLQQILLKNLGMHELACYDGEFSNIVELIPNKGSYMKGIKLLRERMIYKLKDQLENNGSTLFFDIDALVSQDASVLIPLILNRRKRELERMTLQVSSEVVDLRPLWITGYGYEVLRALGMSKFVPRKNFVNVRKAFKELGMTLKLSEKQVRSKMKGNPEISQTLAEHILPAH